MRFLQVSCISEISKNYKKLRKRSVFFVLSRAWDNEKNLSPLEESRSVTLPLSCRESTVSEVYYEVHMTRVRFFSFVPRSKNKTKNIFLYFTELKTHHLSYFYSQT